MKILYHHRTLADGAEGIHITEMVEALQALGHEVVMHALTTSRRRGEGRPSAWGKLQAALPGPVFALGAIVFNLVDYVNFAAALRRHRPDLVYKRHALYDAGVALTCWRAKIPLVLEVNCPYSSSRHRTFEHVGFPRVAQWLERTAFSRATLVATVSSPLGELVHQISDGRARILVVPNGANPRRFTPQTAQPEIRRRLAPEGATLAGQAVHGVSRAEGTSGRCDWPGNRPAGEV